MYLFEPVLFPFTLNSVQLDIAFAFPLFSGALIDEAGEFGICLCFLANKNSHIICHLTKSSSTEEAINLQLKSFHRQWCHNKLATVLTI